MDEHDNASIPSENCPDRGAGLSFSFELANLIKALTATVDKLSSVTNNPPPIKCPESTQDEPGHDSDSEEEGCETEAAGKPNTFEVSEETRTLLQTCLSLPMPANNKAGSAWIAQLAVPQGEETRCPKLNTIIRKELPRDALEADRKLSPLQNFLLDVVRLLATTHNHLVSADDPDQDRTQQAIQLALRILGNSLAQFSQERRAKALGRLNPDLKSLVEDEDFSK